MSDSFLFLKLNRAIWVAYLEENKITEAVNFYKIYHNLLTEYKCNNQEEQNEISSELLHAETIYLNKLKNKIDRFIANEDFSNALICCSAYIKKNQNDIEILKQYIKCLEHLEQYDLQLEVIQYLSKFCTETPDINKEIAQIYAKSGDLPKAIESLEKYIDLVPYANGDDYNLLGCYYNNYYSDRVSEIEYAQKSLEAFKKAETLKLDPIIVKNVTIMASKCNDYKTAGKYWEILFKIKELSNDDKYDYAAYCLKTKDFQGWHKYFDSRFEKENNKTEFPKIDKPRWNGKKDLSKSTLLVHYEQGFGDSILMFGYLPRLAQKAKKVIFVVQNELYPLFKDNSYNIEVLPASTKLSTIKFDYYIPSMSIPTVLEYGEDELSVGEGFITANADMVKEFKSKYFNNKKFKIGLSLSGSTTGDKTRDISAKEFLPLDELENIELYCLTKDIDMDNFSEFKRNKVINISKDFKDFSQTAAAMENLDVVISTDNCILNLAGALGKKTYGLFNLHNQFRWFDLSGENTIWLTSVKPFVNEEMCVWNKSIEKIVTSIKEQMKESNYA